MLVQHSSASVEWYTPETIVEFARYVLGGIDLDPASCEEAQTVVRAERYYTREQDGLEHPWAGRVWLNPPYGRDVGRWIFKTLTAYRTGEIDSGMILVNATPSTSWWEYLSEFPVCFPKRRLHFWAADRSAASPTHSSAIVLMAGDAEQMARFYEKSNNIGYLYVPAQK
jgi:ParB family chromosome partitioning protein